MVLYHNYAVYFTICHINQDQGVSQSYEKVLPIFRRYSLYVVFINLNYAAKKNITSIYQ